MLWSIVTNEKLAQIQINKFPVRQKWNRNFGNCKITLSADAVTSLDFLRTKMSNYEGILETVQGRVTELSSTVVQTQICINGYFCLVSSNVSNLLDLRNTYLTSLLLSRFKV